MPNPLNVPITPPRVAFIDPRSGTVSREWYMFFLSLFTLAGGSTVSLDDLQKGPPMLTVDEINTIVSKASENLRPSTESAIEQIAELQKQIQALESAIRPELGSLSAVNIDWVPYLGFDTAPPWIGTTAGQFWFDSATGAFNAKMGNNNITQQVGEEFFRYGKASAPISDVNLQAVYKTGTVGASGVITFAPTIAGITEADQILGIATEPIATNGFGRITTSGVVRGINTTGSVYGEVWADNDDIWYNPVTGGLTKVKPVAPNIKLQMGTVINAGAGSGSFFVNIGSTSALGGTDSNVQLGTLATSDLLQYNGTYWTNVTPASVINGAGGAPVTKTANFAVAAGETWLINNKSGSSCTVTLPTASTNTGRVLHFQNYQAQTLVSASSNVVPLAGGSATTAILEAVAGANATLVSDGTNWVMTQYDSNNALQLE
jgi:hypothetical protein